MERGIPLRFGVKGIIAWIPNKGLVHYLDLTNDEIRELTKNFSI